MNFNLKKLAVILVSALSVAHASAAPLFNNGPASTHNGFGISGAVNQQSWTTADDFKLTSAANIGSVGFYFNNYNGTSGWDGKISYALFADNGGSPGMLLTSGEGLNVTQLPGDYAWCCGSQNSKLIEFDLQSAFSAGANTSYWLKLGEAGGPSPWWVTSSSAGNAIAFGGYTGHSMAFYLNEADEVPSDVPEPATLALMGLGLAALSVRRRSKQS